MNGKSIRSLASRWLVPATFAFCALYVCQMVPHAHAGDDLAPQPEARRANHSHSPGDHHHHHHDHDSAPKDDRSHHHHALTWHVDLHFGRLPGETLTLAVDDGPAAPADSVTVPENEATTTWHSDDADPCKPIPIACQNPRGPPATA